MKRNNKKGFTIVELVIVIAVIAILAGVLIPTFAGIITKAQDSAALQQASAANKALLAELINKDNVSLADDEGDYYFLVDGKCYTLDANGVVVEAESVHVVDFADADDKVFASNKDKVTLITGVTYADKVNDNPETATNEAKPTRFVNVNANAAVEVEFITINDLNNVVVWFDAD